MPIEVKLTGDQFVFPKLCLCCGAPAESTLHLGRVLRTRTQRITTTWEVPYCRRCERHALFMGRSALTRWLISFTIYVLAIPYYLLVWPVKRLIARGMVGPECGLSAPAGYRYLGETQIFLVGSPAFAKAFALANQEHLVDPSPELRALLDGK